MSRSKKIDFEKSLADLETLVERMEDGELSLEASLKAFEDGIKLSQQCQQALSDAEQKVQVLLERTGVESKEEELAEGDAPDWEDDD